MSKGSLFRMALVLAVLPLVGGCVFLRLNTLRLQMAKFHEHVEFVEDPGPGLVLKKPVLKPGDLGWVTGLDPSREEGDRRTRRLYYTFIKRAPEDADAHAESPAELPAELPEDRVSEAEFRFEKGRLSRVCLPEQYSVVLNGRVVRQLMRKADQADIDKGDKVAAWSVDDSSILPGMKQVRAACGLPTREEVVGEETRLTYHYDLAGHEADEPAVAITFAYLNRRTFAWARGTLGKVSVSNRRIGPGNYRMSVSRK